MKYYALAAVLPLLVDTSTATQVTTRQQQQIITNQQPASVTANSTTTTTQKPTVSASTTQITGTCPEVLDQIFMSGASASAPSPSTQFDQFVNYCKTLNLAVPNGVKIATCFHAGFFVQKNLSEFTVATTDAAQQAENKEEFDLFKTDFCDYYATLLPQRTRFVQALQNIEDAAEFNKVCFAMQEDETDNGIKNTWFDPIDPQASISQKEVCDLHFQLFASLRDKQRTSLSEFVSFSYLASLDLFINATMQEDYENCINMDVAKKPNEWVTKFVSTNPIFLMWDNDSKLEVAGTTSEAISNKCANTQACAETGACQACNACSIGIAQVYSAFETDLNKKFAATFKAYSEDMFNQLHEANLALETTIV